MFQIVLYQPEIPPNTGNIIRLCANTGCFLHLVKPLGFALDDKRLRRAGLDYHEWASVKQHESWAECRTALDSARIYAFTTKAKKNYNLTEFNPGDVMLFGPETRGLPLEILEEVHPEHRLRIPMLANSRSLNLSNAAAVAIYEGWRQLGFTGI